MCYVTPFSYTKGSPLNLRGPLQGGQKALGTTMHRSTVNKRSSARSFNKKSGRTHPKNLKVHRGGYRL